MNNKKMEKIIEEIRKLPFGARFALMQFRAERRERRKRKLLDIRRYLRGGYM